MLSLVLSSLCAPAMEVTADWKVKQLEFSAVSIGVAMTDHTTGWSSFTNGAQAVQITKTTDGGNTWTPVKNQSTALMVMGVAATSSPLAVATTGMLGSQHTTDGDHFKRSLFAPPLSQSIKSYPDGRVALATGSGVCLSKNGGASYECHKAPVDPDSPGRYVAAPSADVIYLSAGMWPKAPSPPSPASAVDLTSAVRVSNRTFALGGSRLAIETGRPVQVADSPAEGSYSAQLLKSTDGGKTWTTLLKDTGAFYFNDVDCIDETHCVVVGEGFGHDGSTSPGSRVYVTSDGTNFTLAHHEQVDGSSLMTAKMLSVDAHVAAGRLDQGVALHTSDAGQTYTKLGSKVKGQMITSMSFITPTHALATAVNSLQICSLLEYGSAPASS